MNPPFKVYLIDNLYKDLILYDSLFHPKTSPQTYPSYSIVCSDVFGVQNINISNPNRPYYVVPTTVAQGIATVFFYDITDTVIGVQTVTFNTIKPMLITPVSGTIINRYTFRCTPLEINIVCNISDFLEPTLPYTFKNDTVSDIISLELTKSAGGFVNIILNPGDSFTPNRPYGYTYYTTTC